MTLSIGFIGYSSTQFNAKMAKNIIERVFDSILSNYDNTEIEIVSGLTNVGIPAIVYDTASNLDIKTVGIACNLAKDYECFPVDEKIIVGTEWGDESKTFINRIDLLVKIGGGKQSDKEAEMFKIKKGNKGFFNFELPST